jgi:low affinity Fe/Cu permease
LGRHFSRLARAVSNGAGSWQAFSMAVLLVLVWALSGLWVGFTDTLYQLAINTSTTIITFWMVFLIQHSQNHDTAAIQQKLDTLILAIDSADNRLIGIEKKATNDA